MRAARPLDRLATRRAMRLSVVEAGFYAVMFGFAELYFIPDAVRMGGSAWALGTLVGLPLAAGAMGALLGFQLLRRAGRRRPIVLIGVTCQATVLLTMSMTRAQGLGTVVGLVASACAYHFCGQLHGASWSSWMGDLVPARIRGRYFSRRTRMVHMVSFGVLCTGGALLHLLEPGVGAPQRGGLGFAALYGLAGLSRCVSAILVASTPEGPAASGASQSCSVSTIPSLRPDWKRPGDRFILIGAFVLFTVYIGAPFFGAYMLESLRFSYLEYTAVSVILVLCKVVAMPRWGRLLDRYGAASIYRVAILLIAVVPLPWLWSRTAVGIGLAEGFSGMAWAGHEVAFFSLILETHDPRDRPRAYTLQAVALGIAQLLGSMTGALAFGLLQDPRRVFATTLVARLAAVVVASIALREMFSRIPIRHRELLLRVVGLRVSGGAVHRPIILPATPLPSTPITASPTPRVTGGLEAVRPDGLN